MGAFVSSFGELLACGSPLPPAWGFEPVPAAGAPDCCAGVRFGDPPAWGFVAGVFALLPPAWGFEPAPFALVIASIPHLVVDTVQKCNTRYLAGFGAGGAPASVATPSGFGSGSGVGVTGSPMRSGSNA